MPSPLRPDDREAARDGFAWLEAESKGAAPIANGYGAYGGYGSYGGFFGPSDGIGPSPADGPDHLNEVVAACLGWLSRNFPVADMQVVRQTTEGDGPQIPGHPAIALLDKPNPTDDFFSFWSAFLLSDVCDGNTFFVKIRNRLGIHSLWWVPPWDVAVVPNPDTSTSAERPVLRYDVRVYGGLQQYKPEDVIHIRDGKDPYYPLRGLAALKAGVRSRTTIDRAAYYTSTLMRNLGAVSYMLSPSDPAETIHPDSVNILRDQFAARTAGEHNGKPFVSPQGLKADRLGLSPEEMALDKIREFPAAVLCALIGTPAMAIGLPDPGKTYSNIEAAERFAWNNGLIPRQARAAEAFDRQCPELIHPTRERLKWDYSHVKALQDDENAKIDGLVKATGGKGFMKRNEARDKLHLDSIDGWDAQDEEPPAPPPALASPDGRPALPAPPRRALPPPGKSGDDEPETKDDTPEAMAFVFAAAPGLAPAFRAGRLDEHGRRELCHAVGEYAAAHLRGMGEALAHDLGDHDEAKMARMLAERVAAAFKGMLKTMRTGMLAATLALRGPDPLSADDTAALSAAVAEQEGYLKQFEEAVRDGSQKPDGTLASRAEMYGRAAWAVAHQVERRAMLASGVTQERRVLGGPEDTACYICPQLADRGWVEADTLPGIGQTPCMSNCRCFFQYR